MERQEVSTGTTNLEEPQRAWVAAEVAGDTETLADLAHEDFVLVGPFGFVLDRQQWLARYTSGDMVTASLEWIEPTVREFGSTAVVIGTYTQRGSYRGQPNDGQFRVTQLWSHDHTWQLAAMHFSALCTPPAGVPTHPRRGES